MTVNLVAHDTLGSSHRRLLARLHRRVPSRRIVQTYFSTFKGLYLTGDGARRDADGYYWITGRVDDAEKAYTEALAIYRELAVDNPGVYAKRVTSLHAELARLNEGLKAGSAGTK